MHMLDLVSDSTNFSIIWGRKDIIKIVSENAWTFVVAKLKWKNSR